MSTIPKNPATLKTIVVTPLNTIEWLEFHEGDKVTHKTFVDFTLYLLQVGALEEGSNKLSVSKEIVTFLYTSFKAGQHLQLVYEILSNHTPPSKEINNTPSLFMQIKQAVAKPLSSRLLHLKGFFIKSI